MARWMSSTAGSREANALADHRWLVSADVERIQAMQICTGLGFGPLGMEERCEICGGYRD